MASKPPSIEMLNMDCREYMATCPDKAFDLAIVDPPYGLNKHGQRKSSSAHGGRKFYDFKDWDKSIPDQHYFNELFRVSENQIIFGANYFSCYLPPSMWWIFWDKLQRIDNSDGELAYSSFNKALRVVEYNRVVLMQEGTIHPTQKPIALYKWLLKNYAKPGQRIFDSHGGSFSSAIAAYYFGCELDKDYYDQAKARFERETRQTQLFDYENPADQPHQLPGSHGYDAVDCFAGH